MLKLTKTGIGLLTKQYKSVLRKCFLLNLGFIALSNTICSSAQALSSIAIGNQTNIGSGGATASAEHSIAIGTYNTFAEGYGSVALGVASSTKGTVDVAIGHGAYAEGSYSLVLGANSRAFAYSSVALGAESEANISYAVSVGNDSLKRRIVNVAAGQNDNDVVILKQLNDALNYYYTKTEADARYALLDTIGDVDYSDEAADEGSALKNGEEDSPTTVRGALDLLDTKIGSLNETGIAGDDVATQLKYILENGSTGGAGVALSTLGYIGANTPYLNTTSNAMNFSSTYTIGGNMATLANQIKTNENSISALNTRVNNLGTYGGTLELTDNYGKVMGDVNLYTNTDQLKATGDNVKAYATYAGEANLKSYTVDIRQEALINGDVDRYYRVQVQATNAEEAELKAKSEIINNGWNSNTTHHRLDNGTQVDVIDNKYIYRTDGNSEPWGHSAAYLGQANTVIENSTDVTVTENNYRVTYHEPTYDNIYTVDVSATSESEAIEKADTILNESWYKFSNNTMKNVYTPLNVLNEMMYIYKPKSTSSGSTANGATITDGSLGTSPTYVLGNGTVIENIALLDSAIGDLSATGVSGNSVAAQLQLLSEVGSEALGQKIGSWNTTKNSISQTLGDETKNYGFLTAFEYDSENEQYVGTVGDNLTALDTALSLTAKDLDALTYQLYNYYYTKTEADARYALLDTIGDVDYSDEAADEGSALKNGAEDSPTTVRGALDLLDTKIGDLNETGIAGDDVATQLKYILENGSTGGAGVTLSTLGYIGANTPYLNTTNESMNFSSNYTIGGNMSTLANQIKTNENSISALNTRVNNLGTYGGTLELTDNYGKVMGDVNLYTNADQLNATGDNVKSYATYAGEANLKSYTVEIAGLTDSNDSTRYYRVQVIADNKERAITLAKEKIKDGWSEDEVAKQLGYWRYINKYMYGTDDQNEPLGYTASMVSAGKTAVQNSSDVTVTENNYRVEFSAGNFSYSVDVSATSAEEALTEAKETAKTGWYRFNEMDNQRRNIYLTIDDWAGSVSNRNSDIDSVTTADSNNIITAGSLGTSPTYVLGNGTVIENIALLDSAIGDLSATGVSGNSVAAQLQLLGEVGSEALGQKIGSWNTTKNGISQTLGEENKNYGYLTAFEYDSENEQYVGTVGDNLQALDAALSLTAKGLDALSYDLYNYYYTFRVGERTEAIEFAKELRSNKKEMSSLDFMPIKSSSDLRINLIKAEDPLTFPAKTKDDSLVLMEVCHA